MKIVIFKRLDRRKTSVAVTLVTVLIALTISFPQAAVLILSQSSELVKRDGTFITRRTHTSENFRFPEVNETEVQHIPLSAIGQVRSLYFLRNDRADQRHISVGVQLLTFFQPALSNEERQIMLNLFQAFVRTCFKYNVKFFLYGGTLLGSLRHHDIIPWDDDIDIMLNSSDRDSLRHALTTAGDQFSIYCPVGQRWKFYWTKANTLTHKYFRWPYIDIFFFSENSTHIFDESFEYRNTFSYPKMSVFPLSVHPFAGAMLPVPCNINSVVEVNYSPSLCTSPKFSHKLESYTPKDWWVTIPCRRLYHIFPFVYKRIQVPQLLKSTKVTKTNTLPDICS